MEKVEAKAKAKAKVEGEDSVWEGPGLPQSSDKYTIIYMPRNPYISLSYLSPSNGQFRIGESGCRATTPDYVTSGGGGGPRCLGTGRLHI